MDSTCPMCSLSMPSDVLNRHIGYSHQGEPNFIVRCDFPGCNKTYNVWKSYRQHNWRKHSRNVRDFNNIERISSSESESDGLEGYDLEFVDNVDPVEGDLPVIDHPPAVLNLLNAANMTPQEKLRHQTALFVANMKENLLIPQTTLDSIVDGTCKLFADYLRLTQGALIGDDDAESIPAEAIKETFRSCNPSSIFMECSTYKVDKFLTENLNRVAPEKVTIGTMPVWSKRGDLVDKDFYAYAPPFKQSLELCLNNPDILYCIDNPQPHEEGTLRSVLDGHYYRTHRIFIDHPKALAFEIYEDDVEITSALSTKSHKLSMFYWSLLNIYPQYRSSHRVQNLLAITKSENYKRFGAKPILNDFLTTMKQLESPEGLKLQVGNEERVFHGLLTFVAGDTPASSLLGGFKESVGGARRPCRRCLISREEVKTVFDYDSFHLRNADSHAEHLEAICSEAISPRDRLFWSKEYGVKAESCLLKLDFDVTKCLPHDPMHTLLEGVLESHATQFIKHCVNEGKFTLNDLNTSLSNFEYGCFVKDKPARIEQAHLDNGIRQNATQMLALGQILPFIVGRYLDDSVQDHLHAFTLLMQIVNVCLAFVLKEEDADILTLMVRCHHERFRALYGDDAITPKWHYLLHVGEQIVLFGPPRQHWCMRLEAQHSYFKNVARRLRNFRNLALSLANRKQNLQCVLCSSTPFLYHGDKVTCKRHQILGNYAHCDVVRQVFPDIPGGQEIVCAGTVEVMGFTYKKGFGILVELTSDALPKFGKIVESVLYDQKTAIVCSVLETDSYDSSLNAYEVEASEPPLYKAFIVSDLPAKHPLPIFHFGSKDYVILTYHRLTEFLG